MLARPAVPLVWLARVAAEEEERVWATGGVSRCRASSDTDRKVGYLYIFI